MTKKFQIFLSLLFVVAAAYGQDITRYEADSLIQILNKSNPDTSRIHLLLQLAKFQIFKPGERKQDLDSAAAYIEKAKALNATLKSEAAHGFITLVDAFMLKESGERELSKKMVEQAIERMIRVNEKTHLADAYFELSDYWDYNDPGQLSEKIKLIERVVLLYQQARNTERQAFCLKVLGDLYDIQGESSKALQKLNLSLETYKSINYTRLQAVYVLLGGIYYEKGNYNQGLYYSLLALKSAETSNDTSMTLCQINNAIAIILTQVGDRGTAINYFKSALAIAEKYDDNANVLLLLKNIVDTYNKMGKPEEGLKVLRKTPGKFLIPKEDADNYIIPAAYLSIYNNMRNFKKSELYADQLLGLIKVHKPDFRQLDHIYNWLISYYISSGQIYTAARFLEKKDSISRKVGDPNTINQNNLLKFRLDTAVGNFRLATYKLLQFNAVKDSLFNETKSKQIKQLEIDYETRKKEDSLKIKDKSILVLNQQNLLQQSNLKNVSLVRNITFAGVAVLFVIMGMLYRQYRIKQKTNQLIVYKNGLLEHLVSEKEWLLKEVHHRVKNNLHTVICLLKSQANYLENDALKAIETSRHRIYAMSLIHQKLYQSEHVKAIDMSVYLPEFIQYLKDSFGIGSEINFRLSIAALQVSISQAIPIALIINEAVTNSIKYAFPDGKTGRIEISLLQDKGQIHLSISDDGVGINGALIKTTLDNSLGLKLMKGLSEDIDAKIHFENFHGTRITVSFKVDPLNKSSHMPHSHQEYVQHKPSFVN